MDALDFCANSKGIELLQMNQNEYFSFDSKKRHRKEMPLLMVDKVISYYFFCKENLFLLSE